MDRQELVCAIEEAIKRCGSTIESTEARFYTEGNQKQMEVIRNTLVHIQEKVHAGKQLDKEEIDWLFLATGIREYDV